MCMASASSYLNKNPILDTAMPESREAHEKHAQILNRNNIRKRKREYCASADKPGTVSVSFMHLPKHLEETP